MAAETGSNFVLGVFSCCEILVIREEEVERFRFFGDCGGITVVVFWVYREGLGFGVG